MKEAQSPAAVDGCRWRTKLKTIEERMIKNQENTLKSSWVALNLVTYGLSLDSI